MLLDSYVFVNINNSNYKRLKNLGYIFSKNGEAIKIKIEHLSNGSHHKVRVKCENCQIIKEIEYNNYVTQMNRGNNKYYCKDCKYNKIEYTVIEKHGVKNVSELDSIKKKKEDTTFKNYGVPHTFQSEINKKKREDTFYLKYGVYHNSQLNSYKEMRIKNAVINNPEFRKYRNKVRRITKQNKTKLFENWNGYDYYDNEYIKGFLNYDYHHNSYPSIDHKISLHYGFLNNISEEDIGNIDNLCVTKRSTNSSKNKKTEQEYVKF